VIKEQRYNKTYMTVAETFSKMSFAVRKQVGAIVVKDGNIISHGWNGMPSGFPNECEIEENSKLTTKKECLHAEANAILKLAKSTNSAENGTLYVTCSPCIECSKLIIQAGISRVFYKELYRDDSGILLLHKAGVEVKVVE
jgi:dCMP deaminase